MGDSIVHLLTFLGGIVAVLGGAASMLLLLLWLASRPHDRAVRSRAGAADLEPAEPGWTETLGTDDGLVCGRGQNFNAELSHQDARGRRGEFATIGDG